MSINFLIILFHIKLYLCSLMNFIIVRFTYFPRVFFALFILSIFRLLNKNYGSLIFVCLYTYLFTTPQKTIASQCITIYSKFKMASLLLKNSIAKWSWLKGMDER